ncbi:MAG: hypothetical protein MZV63_54275 [Marinilabiliales bacterium]|nr:hypothetical protein [Marinilabiliales bacterium]
MSQPFHTDTTPTATMIPIIHPYRSYYSPYYYYSPYSSRYYDPYYYAAIPYSSNYVTN